MFKLNIRPTNIVTSAVLVVAILLVTFSVVQASQPMEQISKSKKHCVAHLEPVDPDSKEDSKLAQLGCFDTFSKAISVATDGVVNLSNDVSPNELTDEMLRDKGMGSNASSVVIGVDYHWQYFDSFGGTFTWSVSSGCSSGVSYRVSSMPSGWNDYVNSARSFSNCNKYYHYEHTNYGGTSITCNMGNICNTMGYMAGKTSSEKWQY